MLVHGLPEVDCSGVGKSKAAKLKILTKSHLSATIFASEIIGYLMIRILASGNLNTNEAIWPSYRTSVEPFRQKGHHI